MMQRYAIDLSLNVVNPNIYPRVNTRYAKLREARSGHMRQCYTDHLLEKKSYIIELLSKSPFVLTSYVV